MNDYPGASGARPRHADRVVGGQRVDTVTSCEPASFWEEAAITDCRLHEKQTLIQTFRLMINSCCWFYSSEEYKTGIIGYKWSCRTICWSICFGIGLQNNEEVSEIEQKWPNKGSYWGDVRLLGNQHNETFSPENTECRAAEWLPFIWPSGSDGKMSRRRCGQTQRLLSEEDLSGL